jgi:hypothetical protein
MKLQCSLLAQPARSLPLAGNSGPLIAVVNTNRRGRYLICPVPFFFRESLLAAAPFLVCALSRGDGRSGNGPIRPVDTRTRREIEPESVAYAR